MSSVTESKYEFDPLSAEMLENPYGMYRLLRREAPLTFQRSRNFWAVMTYANTREVLKTHSVFTNTEGVELNGTGEEFFGRTNMSVLDPPDHRKVRQILSPFFKRGRISHLAGQITEISEEVVDKIADAGEADFAADFAWQVPTNVICALLELPPADRPWLVERAIKMSTEEPGDDGANMEAMFDAAMEVRAYFAAEAARRRKNPGTDLVSIIVQGKNVDGDPISDDDASGLCLHQLAAGIVPVALFLSNALYDLIDEDEIRQRLVDEPEVMPRAVEELWRFDSPVQSLARTALSDYELDGQKIKAGDRVVVFPGSANHDEAIWGADSESIDIDRPFKRNIVLGDGVHTCLGSHMARLEGQIALRALLTRIPSYELAGPIERTQRALERGIFSMPVRY